MSCGGLHEIESRTDAERCCACGSIFLSGETRFYRGTTGALCSQCIHREAAPGALDLATAEIARLNRRIAELEEQRVMAPARCGASDGRGLKCERDAGHFGAHRFHVVAGSGWSAP